MCTFPKSIWKYLLNVAKLTNSEIVLEWLLLVRIPRTFNITLEQLFFHLILESYFVQPIENTYPQICQEINDEVLLKKERNLSSAHCGLWKIRCPLDSEVAYIELPL